MKIVQNAQKTLFFHIFGELCTKCLEKREKTLFSLHFLMKHRAKSSKNAGFCNSLGTLYNVSRKYVKKHCFLSLFAERIMQNTQKTRFFPLFFANFVQSVSKNVKITVFSHFLKNIVQIAQKTLFFAFYGELCTNCLEKQWKNTVFSHFFAEHHAQSSKIACFSNFLSNFVQSVSRKTWKYTAFLTLLMNIVQKAQKTLFFAFIGELCTKCLETRENTLFSHTFRWPSCKSTKNAVFRNFCELCTMGLEKRKKKHCFLSLFCGTSCKILKKRCFSTFFANLVRSVSKNVKNTVSSHFLKNIVQIAQKTLLFAFYMNFVQSVSKNVKKYCFLHILMSIVQRAQKTLFILAFLENFVQCVSKNVKKHCFLSLFDEHRAKSLKKRIFSTFCANFVQKVLKIVKIHCFLHSLMSIVQRSSKNAVFFLHFWRTLYKVSRKTWKKHCFLTLFAEHHAKSSKNTVFRIWQTLYTCVLKNVKIHCFLTLFDEHRAKRSKNAVFPHFLRTLYKVSRKTWKNTVFSHLLRNIMQKAQKTLFLHFLANFVQCVFKNVKKHCFLTLFAEHHAKSSKNAGFCILWEPCTMCLEKREKTLFSHTFWWTSCKIAQKTRFFPQFLRILYKVSRNTWKYTVFSHFSMNMHRANNSKTLFFANFMRTLYKWVSKNSEKTLFSLTFLRNIMQNAQKSHFFAFCVNFVQSVSKIVKIHCFSTLFEEHRAKSSKKKLFFAFFGELCTKCLEKREKTLFSHTYCGTSCKKLNKHCF